MSSTTRLPEEELERMAARLGPGRISKLTLMAAASVLCMGAAALESERRDLDEDGVPERIETRRDGGSGYSMTEHCITHGATSHRACRRSQRTAYAWFGGERTVAEPAGAANAALPLLPALKCSEPAPDSPEQAAMWLLTRPSPREGAVPLGGLRWYAGKPVEQVPVCLTLEQSRALSGALAWEPSGSVEGAANETVVVLYTPRGWSQSGRRTPDPALREVLSVGSLRFLVAGHALSVYDSVRNRHAWLLDYAGGDGSGFKLDRLETIAKVSLGKGKGKGETHVVVELGPRGRVTIDLQRLMDGEF